MNEIKKYFELIQKIRSGQRPSKDELSFFLSYTPTIDESKLKKLVDGGEFTSTEDARNAMVEVGRLLQSSPEYKQDVMDLAQSQEAGKISENLSQGINLILGGADIGTSIAQIQAGNRASRNSRRPSRPVVPGRDALLQNALRQAEEGQFDAARAMAPVQQQIEDQYLSDIQGAKTASTGQAGAYGAYRQLASNNRNRAALNLAPIQDEVRRGQQARYDNLLGMRMDETQQQFRNQAYLYPQDLEQYNTEQGIAARVGQAGRLNLRDSLYNLGGQVAGSIGSGVAQRRFDQLRNQALASGMSLEDAEKYVVGADQKLRSNMGINYRPNYNPQTMFEQMYNS